MRSALLLALTAAVALAGCDQPKPRPPPPPGGPPGLAMAPAAPLADAGAEGLTKRQGMAGFSIDVINQAPDPINRPATIAAGQPAKLSGFGYDPEAKAPGKAVQLVLDGVPYPTTYGAPRPDVAEFVGAAALVPTGYAVVLPGSAITAGRHRAVVRVISADGMAYNESPPIVFEAK